MSSKIPNSLPLRPFKFLVPALGAGGDGPTIDPQNPCCECGVDIKDHIYRVKRRRIRAVEYDDTGRPKRHDAIHTWHDGVIVGPETDDYCPKCYALLPEIQDLLDDYKRSLPAGST